MMDYYYVLRIVDRISAEALKKFGTYGKFSVACGKRRTWWYKTIDSGCGITFNTLMKCAEVLELPAEYLLTGRGTANNLSIEHIGRIRLRKADSGVFHTIRWRIKRGLQHDLCLTTLYRFEDITGIRMMKILKGEF